MKIVLLPAKGSNRAPDPVFFLEGGPGAAATMDAAEFAGDPVRARRDIVLIDTRGVGGSNPLSCPIWGDGTRLDHIFPLDAVTACRDELRKRADLARYTTAAAMDDVDEVRRYLGYGPVNLSGASYGTFTAQIFLARHPEAVRSVVLSSVVKPGEPAPLNHARNAQQALELLARDCAAEPACHAAFPHFKEEVSTVLDRLAKQPVKVQVKNPETGRPVTVALTRSAAADALRFALYSPDKASQVPLRVHLAAQGDYRELARTAVMLRFRLQKGLALGALFSISCAEDLSRIDPREIPAATRGTFYGDDRVREQLAVCGVWPHAPLPAGERALVHSNVPVLLFSGERGPVTPPADAALVAKGFPHGLLVTIPHGTHAGAGKCEERLIADFIERGSTQGLDLSCIKTAPPEPFVTSVAKLPKGVDNRRKAVNTAAMKTTFDLPDALVRKAKALAAQQGRPLRDLVAEAIDEKVEVTVGGEADAPKAGEVRREAWERWKSRLERRSDGIWFNPESIDDESFFRSLEEVRREPWAKRDPFGSDS